MPLQLLGTSTRFLYVFHRHCVSAFLVKFQPSCILRSIPNFRFWTKYYVVLVCIMSFYVRLHLWRSWFYGSYSHIYWYQWLWCWISKFLNFFTYTVWVQVHSKLFLGAFDEQAVILTIWDWKLCIVTIKKIVVNLKKITNTRLCSPCLQSLGSFLWLHIAPRYYLP